MDRLILYAPVDFGFELDLAGARQGFDSAVQGLQGALSNRSSNWVWSPPTTATSPLVGYGGTDYHAPSTRPAFLASASLDTESMLFERVRELLAGAGFGLDDLRLVVQEYGIGCLELDCLAAQEQWDDPGEFTDSLCFACEEPRILRALRLSSRQAVQDLLSASEESRVPLCEQDSGLTRRLALSRAKAQEVQPSLVWFHSLLLIDNRSRRFGEMGSMTWLRKLNQNGVFSAPGFFFDHAFSFRCVEAVPFVTRSTEACAIFGWGNSAMIFAPHSERGDVRELSPIREVMLILQCFSAGLFRLNRDLLAETVEYAHPEKWHSYRLYHYKLATIDNLRVRAEMFLAMIQEQRYAQSRHEQALWDQASRAWELDDLRTAISRNLDLLKTVYDQRRRLLDEHVKRRVSTGVSLVTLLSAAGVAFVFVDGLLSGPDWERVIWQGAILMVLLAISAYLLARPGPSDIRQNRFLNPRPPPA